MKFLCDQMLSRVGKWLRAAGHDTYIVTQSIPDKEVCSKAVEDARFLLTRDRHFLKMKAAIPFLIYLKNNDFERCMQELNRSVRINWLLAPFSRCLICNSLFAKPAQEKLKETSPPILQQKREFWYCPVCQKTYWEGTHTANMLRQLTFLQREAEQFHSRSQ
jgi:uncharacterized protein